MDYNYKNEMSIKSINEILKLNICHFFNSDIILNIFDVIYKENHMSTKKEDENWENYQHNKRKRK